MPIDAIAAALKAAFAEAGAEHAKRGAIGHLHAANYYQGRATALRYALALLGDDAQR